jgi:glutamate-1-semialdehyde 2,1-aminomutase
VIERQAIAALCAREAQGFVQRHPRCASLARDSERHFLFGVPMHWMDDWGTPSPLFVQQACGAHLVCADGHQHADFCLADSAAMFGHSPPALARGLVTRADHGFGAMLPGVDTPQVGRLLAQRFGLPLWQMALSATDANRFCLRWALAATGRPRILVFDGCYHGTVDDVFVDREILTGGEVRLRTRASLLGQVSDLTENTRVVEFNDLRALAHALADRSVACVMARAGNDQCRHGAAQRGISSAPARVVRCQRHVAPARRNTHPE